MYLGTCRSLNSANHKKLGTQIANPQCSIVEVH
jgi:hypothetical protein